MLGVVIVILVVHAMPVCIASQEAKGVLLILDAVEGKLQVRSWDEADENVVSKDGETSVQLPGLVQVMQFLAQVRSWDEGRIGDVDDSVSTEMGDNVAQFSVEDRVDFVVEKRVRVHVCEKIIDAERFDGVGGPFGAEDGKGERKNVVEIAS